MLAEAGSGTFAGAVTLGVCPDLEIKAKPCHGAGLRYVARPSGKGIDLASSSVLGGPWWALHGERDGVCDIDATRTFVAAAPDATMVSLPKVGHGYSVQRNWLPQLLDTYRTALARAKNALATPSLPGLSLVEMPTELDGDLFAVLVSGDGGRAGLDKEVAARLVARGIPVVGLDSLRYFWKERTPDSFAADLDQILNFYADHWGTQRALVIGYSQGADVLPFALNRLSPDANALIERAVLLAPAEMASFEFHLTNWIGGNSGDLPVKPEIERLDLSRVTCLYGQEESDESPCTTLGTPARVRALPGGHHFNGAYSELVSEITAGVSR
jgi:type IV secretory pathway VirJ component